MALKLDAVQQAVVDAGSSKAPAGSPDDNGTVASVLGTMYLSLVAGGCLLVLFECLRGRKNRFCRCLYRQRHSLRFRKINPKLRAVNIPAYPRGILAWVYPSWKIGDTEFLEQVGMDGYITLRFIRLCRRLCVWAVVWGLGVLVPIYSTGDIFERGQGGVYWMTMSNLYNGSELLWAPTFFAWVFTMYLMHSLREESVIFNEMRNDWLAEGERSMQRQTSYTVMIERIPRAFRSPAMLQKFFDTLFPGQVHCVSICLGLDELKSLQSRRDKALYKLERAIILKQALGKDQYVRIRGRKHLAIEYYMERLVELNHQLRPLQEKKLAAASAVEELRQEELRDMGSNLENMALFFVSQLDRPRGGGVTNPASSPPDSPRSPRQSEFPRPNSPTASRTGRAPLLSMSRIRSLKMWRKGATKLELGDAEQVVRNHGAQFVRSEVEAEMELSRQAALHHQQMEASHAMYNANRRQSWHGRVRKAGRNHSPSRRRRRSSKASLFSPPRTDVVDTDAVPVELLAAAKATTAANVREMGMPRRGSMLLPDSRRGSASTSPAPESEAPRPSDPIASPPANVSPFEDEDDQDKGDALDAVSEKDELEGDGSDVGEEQNNEDAKEMVEEDEDEEEGDEGTSNSNQSPLKQTLRSVPKRLDLTSEDPPKINKHRSNSAGSSSVLSNFRRKSAPIFSENSALSPALSSINRNLESASRVARHKVRQRAHDIKTGVRNGAFEVAEAVKVLTVGSMSGTGFVTFKSLTARAFAVQSVLTSRRGAMMVTAAPEPRDILWDNVTRHVMQINSRRNAVNILLTLGIVFWSVVVSGIQALGSPDSIQKTWPAFYEYLITHAYAYKLVTQYVPVVLLLTLINTLYFILKALAKRLEGYKSESEVERVVMSRYFYYQLANIYVTVTAGSIFEALTDILDDPRSVLTLLGAALPKVAVYFTNLITVKVVAGLMMELCFGGRPLKFWKILCIETFTNPKLRTKYDRTHGVFEPSEPWYGRFFADFLLVLLVVFTYQCIAPFVSIAGLVYFLLAEVIYKYQLVHCFWPLYESGGLYFYTLFRQIVLGATCGLVTTIGYVSIRGGISQVAFLVPLPFIVVIYGMRMARDGNRSSNLLSLDKAAMVDRENELNSKTGEPPPWVHFSDHSYRQPTLRTAAEEDIVLTPTANGACAGIRDDDLDSDVDYDGAFVCRDDGSILLSPNSRAAIADLGSGSFLTSAHIGSGSIFSNGDVASPDVESPSISISTAGPLSPTSEPLIVRRRSWKAAGSSSSVHVPNRI